MSDEAPRLFLITPALSEVSHFVPLLEAALDAGDVACLLIRAAAPDEGSLKAIVRTLAPIAQARDVACLIENNSRLAPRVGADGVHIDGFGAEFTEAVAALQPDRIVGIGHLADRDAAMEAGEAGADYLFFGGPDDPADHDAIRERVEWWAAIFNVPCVGYAHDPAKAGELAAAGADFIALCDGLWDRPDEIAGTIAAATRALVAAHEARA